VPKHELAMPQRVRATEAYFSVLFYAKTNSIRLYFDSISFPLAQSCIMRAIGQVAEVGKLVTSG
jgi:hypothetical protein